jgi:hypothetical protein
LWLPALLIGLAAVPFWGTECSAAEVDFIPRLVFTVERDGNVAITGEGPERESLSDEMASLSLDLSLAVNTNQTRFLFAYRPEREAYNEFSDLDNTSHRVSLSAEHDISRRSNFSVELDAARSDRQTLDLDGVADPRTLVPRTTIDAVAAATGGRVQTGRRAFFTWGLGGGIVRLDDRPGVEFEDSDLVEATLGFGLQASRQSSYSLEYEFQNFSFETIETTDVHSVRFVNERRFGQHVTMALRLGALRAELDGGDSDTDPYFDLMVSRTIPRGSTYTFGLRQEASAGTGLAGVTRDRGAYLSWGRLLGSKLDAEILAGYWQREGLALGEAEDPETETLGTTVSLTWSFSPAVSLGLFHAFIDQNESDGTADFLDTSYHSGGIRLTWTMRGG